MKQCPYCGRWFKNRFSLMSHLKYCPAKNGVVPSKTFLNEVEVKEFDFMGYHWFIRGKKGFMDILRKVDKKLIEQGFKGEAKRVRLIGALYALNVLGIVERFSVTQIKQQKQQPQAPQRTQH